MNERALDPLRPRRPGGMGRGAMFALVVHVGLLAALAIGVSWRSSEPAGVTAELWAAVPEVAAPAAVAPVVPPQPAPKPEPRVEPKVPPPPPKPEVNEAEIALERAKVEKARREREEKEVLDRLAREREAREKAEAQKRQREQAEKLEREKAEKQAKADAKQREENLKRMMGQAGATGAPQSTGSAQRDAGPSANYAGRIIARVRPNIVLTDSVPATLLASVELRVAPDGTIVSRRLVKSSGNATWDEAVLRAIDRTETLPKDEDGRVPPAIVIDFRPV